jgi:hypothetical protein
MAYNLYYIFKKMRKDMKTIKMSFMKLFLLIGIFLVSIGGTVYSQEVKSHNERKRIRKMEMAENFRIIDSLLQVRSFVLEANYLQNKWGMMTPVSSTLNFIRVNGSVGVFQTGFDWRIGSNGVGGFTVEGSVGGWKVTKDVKSLSYTLTFNLLTNIGNFDIFMTVTSDNNATATITGTGSGKLSWEGHLATVDNSQVFKGIPRY